MAKRTAEPALPRIFTVRKQKGVLDAELAKLFGVSTRVFNQAVRRNAGRFPSDSAFQLTGEEFATLKSQFATSSSDAPQNLRSQIVTLKTGTHIDRKLIEHDVVLRKVLERLQPLLDAPDEGDDAKPKIGFHKGNR